MYNVPGVPVNVRPLKVATPATKLALAPALNVPPAPIVIAAVAAPEVTLVTTLPPESSTLTTGCWARTTPDAVEVLGSVAMTSFDAVPSVTATLADIAGARAPSLKVSV